MRPIHGAIGCLVVLLGCGRAPVSRAYIDVERVAWNDPLPLDSASPNPTPPDSRPGSTTSIEPLAARSLDFSENKARLAKVRAAVDEARERTVRELARQLRNAYQREVDAIEAKRLADVPGVRAGALDKAWARVRTRFLAYANGRAAPAIRLALYSGFPDPDPAGRRKPDASQKIQLRRFERAQQARTTLLELDQTYETDVRRILADYDDEVASAITDIRVEIEKMRAEAEDRARKDALEQAAKQAEEIESVLSGSARVDLPARPGASSTIPATEPLPEPPKLEFSNRSRALDDRRNAVRSDARIWAAHFGVELVDKPDRAPDRTDEFVAWRKKRQLGR